MQGGGWEPGCVSFELFASRKLKTLCLRLLVITTIQDLSSSLTYGDYFEGGIANNGEQSFDRLWPDAGNSGRQVVHHLQVHFLCSKMEIIIILSYLISTQQAIKNWSHACLLGPSRYTSEWSGLLLWKQQSGLGTTKKYSHLNTFKQYCSQTTILH